MLCTKKRYINVKKIKMLHYIGVILPLYFTSRYIGSSHAGKKREVKLLSLSLRRHPEDGKKETQKTPILLLSSGSRELQFSSGILRVKNLISLLWTPVNSSFPSSSPHSFILTLSHSSSSLSSSFSPPLPTSEAM